MTERVRENDVASAVYQVLGGLIAGFAFVDTGHDDHAALGNTEVLACLCHGVDEVLVVRGLLIVEADQADFDVLVLVATLGVRFLAGTAGSKSKNHNQ